MLAAQYFGYFEELEKVSSRLTMLEILSRMFNEMEIDEANVATHLMFGNLGSSYNSEDFGMADKMVMRAICKAFDVPMEIVLGEFKSLGDMGLVVSRFADKNSKWGITVINLYSELEAIAKHSGEGSQDEKIDKLANLLKRADVISAKYLVRIPLGKLRLGVGQMTVLDGLSWLVCGDKSLHVVLEEAYNVAADVGILAYEVLNVRKPNRDEWRESVVKVMQNMQVMIGVPMVMALCTRMATFDEVNVKLGEVVCEPKYDGNRVQIHFWRDRDKVKVKTFSRNLEESTNMFPELKQIGQNLDVDEIILDCEAMGIDIVSGKWATFQVTMTRKRKHGIEEKLIDVPLKFMVFDVLFAKGRGANKLEANGDIHGWPLRRRRELLESVVKPNDLIMLTPVVISSDSQLLRNLHMKYLDEGLEGVILKQIDSPYVPGRKKGVWVKMKEVENADAKLPDTVDCVIMGYYRGEGRRGKFGIGSLLLGVRGHEAVDYGEMTKGLFDYSSKEERYWTVSKLGSKLTDEQLMALRVRLDSLATTEKNISYEVPTALIPDVWVKPEIVVEVAADNLTKSPLHSARLALRFPRLVRVRDDKNPEQATSIEELNELFKIQKG